MFSVYMIYESGAKVEIRQFKSKSKAIEYAKKAAAYEQLQEIGFHKFIVCKVSTIATFGGAA